MLLIDIIVSLLALIVTLGILVTIHEFGHFWVARRCGVKVLTFSIGFGKAIKSWRGKDGVEYVIAPIPLGGYVRMLGQDDTAVTDPGEVSADERHMSFATKPLWQRSAIVAAGPIANFILAAVVYWIINITYGVQGYAPVASYVEPSTPAYEAGLRAGDEIIAIDGEETSTWQQVIMQLLGRMGESGDVSFEVLPEGSSVPRQISVPIAAWMSESSEPNPVADLGIVQYEIPAVIGSVLPGSRAEQGGLQAGDRVVATDGIDVRSWMHWVRLIQANAELDLDVVVQREGNLTQLSLRPESRVLEDGSRSGYIGAGAQPTDLASLVPEEQRRHLDYNIFTAVLPALQDTWDRSLFVLDSVKKMVVGLISVKNINGPITIAQVAGDTASYGLDVYLGFLAILSISLGVLNLLPIPVLDGGHLLYYLIEAVTRRPVPVKVQAWGLQLGVLIISGIMVLAVYNDVSRLL
ncbi:MAG: RIP metalloprotease RseP [Pseudohongiellaceae bacterium]